MRYIHCLNNISAKGTDLLTDAYELTDDLSRAEGILVRSAAMHDLELPKCLRAVAPRGRGREQHSARALLAEGSCRIQHAGRQCERCKGARHRRAHAGQPRHRRRHRVVPRQRRRPEHRQGGRESQETVRRTRDPGQEAGRHRPGRHRRAGGERGRRPWAWTSTATILTSPLARRGACRAPCTTSPSSTSCCAPATTSPSTCPPSKRPSAMIDERACSLMKDGAVFLNFSGATPSWTTTPWPPRSNRAKSMLPSPISPPPRSCG